MNKLKNEIELGFTKQNLPKSCHVCLIYENEEQRQKIVSEYIADGLKQGEIVRYFADKTLPETVRCWLNEKGVEIAKAEEKGDFGFAKAENAYCPDGQFEPRAMIDRTMNRYEVSEKEGYKGSRACGEMSWALKGIPGSERLLEYEVLLNTIKTTFPHTGMCQYDARLFDGATLFKILQVHPYIIAQGQVVQNPYYIRPEEFETQQEHDKSENV
jgi:hypothetical protein